MIPAAEINKFVIPAQTTLDNTRLTTRTRTDSAVVTASAVDRRPTNRRARDSVVRRLSAAVRCLAVSCVVASDEVITSAVDRR